MFQCLLGDAGRSAHVFIGAVCTTANQCCEDREINHITYADITYSGGTNISDDKTLVVC